MLGINEKSQSQATGRTQTGLPRRKGRSSTTTRDYPSHGRTTPFDALTIFDGAVTGPNPQRYRHRERIRFVDALECDIPAGKVVHAILGNCAVHGRAKVRALLDGHPRGTVHFTPTSGSRRNTVDGDLAKLSRRRLSNGVFRSVVALQATINRFLAKHNQRPEPLALRVHPGPVIAARNRGFRT